MSLVGFDLAFTHRDPIQLTASARVAVPHAEIFMLLKMVSWLDRPPDRAKDLQDIAHLLENYLPDDDMRHWSDELVAANLDHDLHSPYALGRDLGTIIEDAHGACIDRFLRKPPLAALIARGPRSWANDDDRAERVLETFERGLRERRET